MSRRKDYKRFTTAATSGDELVTRRYVARNFTAILRGHHRHETLMFEQYMAELARQREAFPDLGKNIKVVRITEEGNRLIVTYVMTVTFTGVLRSRDRKQALQPTGNTVKIISQDYVDYDTADKILRLEIFTDTAHVFGQMFS